MTAVAQRRAVGLFAVAERHLGGLLHNDLLGSELGAFMGAITERLPLGVAAGTPIVSSRRQFDDCRFFISYVSFAHSLRVHAEGAKSQGIM